MSRARSSPKVDSHRPRLTCLTALPRRQMELRAWPEDDPETRRNIQSQARLSVQYRPSPAPATVTSDDVKFPGVSLYTAPATVTSDDVKFPGVSLYTATGDIRQRCNITPGQCNITPGRRRRGGGKGGVQGRGNRRVEGGQLAPTT